MTEDNFTIRKASPADLPRIHGIYAAARQFMRDHGNFSQWDGEDAPEHLLPAKVTRVFRGCRYEITITKNQKLFLPHVDGRKQLTVTV